VDAERGLENTPKWGSAIRYEAGLLLKRVTDQVKS